MTRTHKSLLLTALLVVSAMAAGVSGGAVSNVESTYQTQDDGLADATVSSGETFWQGEYLQFSAGQDNASEVWAVRRVGDDGQLGGLVTEVLLDGNGSAVFGTSGLDGQFAVVNENDQPVVIQNGNVQRVGGVGEASFEIATQSLNASFADDVVRNDDDPAARTDLQIQSNRAGYGLYLLSDQLSAEQLADVFSSVEVEDGEAVTTRQIGGDDALDANFTGLDPGTYNVSLVTTDGTAEATATIEVIEPVEGSASLENATAREERGDVARFNVTFDGTDRATVTVGSEEVGYLSEFTVNDVNGDGVATVAFNTYEAGLTPATPGVSAVGEDNVTGYELQTDPIPGRLDAATYPIEVSVGATRTDVGSILLSERSTGGIQVWTAPDAANVGSPSAITQAAAQDSDIAYEDWVVVQVEASGLYGYVQNISDLNDNRTGISMNLTRVGEINVPEQDVPLEEGRLIVDEPGNQLFLVLDSNSLDEGTTYSANFTISDANPYVGQGNGTSLVANFSVVQSNVTIDRPVEVPASSDATISGNSTLAPGTELNIEAANTAQSPFLKSQTATVSEDGTWEATFDFSDVEAGTNFTVSIAEPSVDASGQVVSAGAAQETTVSEETTTVSEETTVADETAEAGADEDTDAAGADEETTEAAPDEETATETEGDEELGDEETETPAGEAGTTTAETTTVEAATAPAPGFGPLSLLAGLAVLLAAGAFVARRR